MKLSRYITLALMLVVALSLFAQTYSAASPAVYSNLDERSGWKSCGTCGDSKGSTAKANYSFAAQSTVSRDGTAALFSLSPLAAYGNGFEYLQMGANAALTHFVYEFDVLVPAKYAAAPQAIEFQTQQVINGVVYNFAWQAEWRSKMWRTFDYAGGGWQSTGVALVALADGNWHHVKTIGHRDTLKFTAVDDAIVVDGIPHQVGAVHASELRYSSTSNALNVAFQLDSTSALAPYSILLDKVTLTAW